MENKYSYLSREYIMTPGYEKLCSMFLQLAKDENDKKRMERHTL